MNINELVASIEVELEAAQAREAKARKTIEVTLATAQQDGNTALSEEDEALVARSFETIELAQAAQESIKNKLAQARRVQASEADFDARMANATAPANLPQRDSGQQRTTSFSVGREERTYTPQNDPNGTQFLSDVAAQFISGDVRSTDRLRRHMQEETVERAQQGFQLRASSVGTGAFSGLTVPQYLVDMVAPHIANLRPFADICNKHALPPQGMSLNISRITTASTVGLQASENTAVSGTAMGDTLLTINVQTAAGQQTISRQAIERGTGIEDVVLQDLFRQHATQVDNTLVNGATHGLHTVAGASHVYTDASPTAAALYPKLLGGASDSELATLGMAHPTHVLMHPRRWYWMQAALGSTWPLINSQGVTPRTIGENNPDVHYDQGLQGVLPSGLRVVMDANIVTNLGAGTNQDEIFVVPDVECHLWEDGGAPVYIRAEQPAANSLGILLVVYSYFAYTFERYASATQVIGGTGLVAPSF